MLTLLVNDADRELQLSNIKTAVNSPLCRNADYKIFPTELRCIPADLGQGQTEESRPNDETTERNGT